jgi:mutator protein MutT
MSMPTQQIALALVHREDRWLVAQRKNDTHLAGLWEFPGGKIELHETAAQAALRELYEECAVRAKAECVLDAVTCEYDDRIVQLTPVICRWDSGEPQPLGNQRCRWVSGVDLQLLEMPAVDAAIVRAALAYRR